MRTRRGGRWIRALVLGVGLMVGPRASLAVDSVGLEWGNGALMASDLYRLSLVWDWPRLADFGGMALTGYWDAGFGWWHRSDRDGTRPRDTADIGFTPVFRLQASTPLGGCLPFVEGAVGLHVLSRPSAFGRRIATAFEFGDHVGVGLRVPGRFEIGYRLQHYSNAGIAKPNGGMNFHILRLAAFF